MTKTLPLYLLAVALFLVAASLFLQPNDYAAGAGWLGTQSHIQSATSTTAGPDTVVTLFADNSPATCHARVISTTNSAIMLSFDDYDASTTGQYFSFGSTTLSEVVGHWQPASTTVAYDAGLYGCGRVTVYGFSSSTVTVSSF